MSWTKIDNLILLAEKNISGVSICEAVIFDVAEWSSSREQVVKNIIDRNLGPTLITRSCAFMEDGEESPPPGYYKSVLGVDGKTFENLERAIDTVIASYSRGGRTGKGSDRLFIQAQLKDCSASGVAHLAVNGYIRLDLAENGSETDAVTSGRKANHLILSCGSYPVDQEIELIKNAITAIGDVFEPPIWIEFGIDQPNSLTVFQVRTDRNASVTMNIKSAALVEKIICNAQDKVMAYGPLSNMSDWNPAELLGVNPGRLDVSLYRKLITDTAWLEGRSSLGWRTPIGNSELVCEVMNRPYVILRKSLESLLPNGLTDELTLKLVNYYLELIRESPDKHDKIEFEIIHSAFAIDTKVVRKQLLEYEFTESEVGEYFQALKLTTRNAFRVALTKIESSEEVTVGTDFLTEFEFRSSTTPQELASYLEKTLLDICSSVTVEFSRQARLAFMCNFIVRRMVELKPEEKANVQRWIEGLDTVTTQFRVDLHRFNNGHISKLEIDEKYGFLRPNSYNIESLTYSERPDLFMTSVTQNIDFTNASLQISNSILMEILSDIDSNLTNEAFWKIASSSYQFRESIKFQYSYYLSNLLSKLVELCSISKISRANLRMYRIDEIVNKLHLSGSFVEFGEKINKYNNYRQIKKAKILSTYVPDLIMDSIDLRIIKEVANRPTFIGDTEVTGEIAIIDASTQTTEVEGKVVVINSPDPGYEWVFGHSIIGMITGYGGAFSHIALRCSEINITAAIGVGPRAILLFTQGQLVKIDPESKNILTEISGNGE